MLEAEMKNNKLTHSIRLVTGDWSSDGHGKTSNLNIKSNLSLAQIEKAYKAGTKILGTDIIENVCRDYEDNNISCEFYNKMIELGFDGEVGEDENLTKDISVWHDDWPYYVLFVVKLGNKDFKYSENTKGDSWNIGGYGLFK